jgi:Ca2+-binding EF-hand superfamily protein
MKTTNWKVIGLFMALAGAATLANAEPEQGGPRDGDGSGVEQPRQRRGQGDRKGKPSREEILKKYDKDGDGELSEEELKQLREDRLKEGGRQQGRRPSREEMLERFDKDGDGELSEEERQAMREAMGGRRGPSPEQRKEMMEKFDTDGDGELSEEERAAMRKAMEKRRRPKQREGGTPPPEE